ncbi:MAG: O-antigen ligase family protein [bacterium]|nr:O-antigen ligase family protein [bacterium]
MRGGGDTAKQIARWVALGALFLIPLTPLIVANTFFFPFITGKAFYFRILVEITVAAWAVLCFLDKEYRPRFSWAGAAVVAFVGWMLVADSFAPNAAKAFWSNFERMEGWVLLVHLLGFFFAASAVLRVQMKWRAWFLTSLAVSLVVSGYALFQLSGGAAIHQGSTRIDASLGNSAYLAIYLLFNIFIAGWLALTERRAWLKWSLIALAVLEAVLLFFTETRGTILGLTIALALATILTALTAGKGARRYAVGGLALIVILAGSLALARDSSFVQGNSTLQRVASLSLEDGQTRFAIWHMAYQGFLASPVVGWGQEGFNYVFDQFYDPSLYHQEPWFDRAHNAFIDWLIAGGLPAFLLFISLFVSAVWLLWTRSELSRPERIALTCALVGYAFHNLLVFDNLYSYVYFFAILALIDSQVARPLGTLERAPELDSASGVTYALPIAAIAACGLIWFVNVPSMTAVGNLITAISPSASGPSGNIAAFEKLVAHPGHAEQEIREQLVSFASSLVQSQGATDGEKRQAVALAVDEMKKQVARYPLDTREQLQLAYAYRAAGDVQNALAATLAATSLSPTMEQAWIFAGAAAWDAGDMPSAQLYFDKAYALAPEFKDLAVYAAAGAYAAGDAKKGDAVLVAAYGTDTVDSDVLAVAYYRAKDWPRLIRLWKLRVAAEGASPQTFFSLAAAYYTAGDSAGAISTIREAIARFPEAADAGAAAITQIQTGKVGQ